MEKEKFDEMLEKCKDVICGLSEIKAVKDDDVSTLSETWIHLSRTISNLNKLKSIYGE